MEKGVKCTVRRILGISPQGSPLLAKAALDWVWPKSIVATINNSNQLHVNENEIGDPMLLCVNSPLLDLVRQVVWQLSVKDKIIEKYYNA